MRLPWPFGRSASSVGRSPAGGGPAPSPAAAGPTPAPATGAWAALPPIQRTVGAAPLVAPSKPFLADVPGHNPLPPIVGPLGHETGPGAPPGLVVAHARPVPSLTARAPLRTRPVQRRAGPGRGDSGIRPWVTDTSTAGGEMPAGSDGEPASAMPAVAPVRTLAAIPDTAAVQPAARPLTQAPQLSSSVQRATRDARPVVRGAPIAAPGRARSSPGPQGTGSAPSTASPGTALPLQRAGTRRSEGGSRWSEGATASAPASAGSNVPTAGPTRRPGLGAPISVPPATAVAQRLPMRTPGTRQSPATSGTDASGSPLASSGPGLGPPLAQPPLSSRPLPVLPVARKRSGEPAGSTEPSAFASRPATNRSTATSPGNAHAQRASGRASVPTLGTRPLRPASVTTQRQAAAAPSEAGALRPTPVPAHWTGRDDLPGTITARRQPDVVTGQPEPVRLGSVEPGAGGRGPAFPAGLPGAGVGADAPREIVFPPRDAATPVAGGPATPRVPDVQRHVQRLAGMGAPRLQSGSTGASLALARPGLSQGATTGTSRANGSPTAPGTAASGSPAGMPAIQATRIETGPGLPAFTTTPVVQRIDGTAPTTSADAEERSDAELDELAGALFGRIRAHLRSEVIHEREARGLTFDAF